MKSFVSYLAESESIDAVKQAITRRIMNRHLDLLRKYGPEKVLSAIDDVAEFAGRDDLEEIGSSDVSGWVKHVIEILEKSLDEAEQVTIAPATEKTQEIRLGDKTLGTISDKSTADAVQRAIRDGKMSLAGDEVSESKLNKIAGTKHKGLPKKKTNEADIPNYGSDFGAGLGAGRNQKVLESMNKTQAAYHEGKSHGLSGHSYSNRYDEGLEERNLYHEGFKEGLDEAYGMAEQLPPGKEVVEELSLEDMQLAEVDLDEMDRGDYLDHRAKTTKGKTFKAFGQTFPSDKVTEADSYAFETWDRELNSLLNEGLSVNMSQGLSGINGRDNDTVSVTATGDDASKLIDFIKQVGLGGLGSSEEKEEDSAVVAVSDYGAPKYTPADTMKSLLGAMGDRDDYEVEVDAEEKHGSPCMECGMNETECKCDEEVVAEDDGEGTLEAGEQDAEINSSMPAKGGATNEEELNEWANNAGGKGTDASFEEDVEFMTQTIAGGLNKPKRDQTTLPHTAVKVVEDDPINEWKKLSGII